MLAKKIIPRLDLKNGRVVKGVNFINLVGAGDPVECATAYDRAGADEIVFLDVTASHEKREIMLDVVRRTAEKCFMPVTIGGGLRTLDNINAMLRAGADKVSLNTPAVEHILDAFTIGRANAALAASIFHFGTYTIVETKKYLIERGVTVRPVCEVVSPTEN